ncbi:aldo/keto reductase [Auriculariales sp. MPI-PUGE-AT-0066]|nr:aldo/keto reductase [Auriculariales sp. MPI-PUGE-AT-0066]
MVALTHFGGTASATSTPKIGHGTMMMTWKPTHVPDEQCFAAIRATVEALPAGAKAFIVSGEFYGIEPREANLDLLKRYFDRYPEDKEKIFISVKGGLSASWENIHTEENLRQSVDNIKAHLGSKHLDLFECARVDQGRPIEETIATLAKLVKEGKFDHIGLSECSVETLRRAHAVHPISIVEIEVSPWSYEDNAKGVIALAKELGVTVAAYSPLGRGVLVGRFKSTAEIEDGDIRKHLDRFKDGNFEHNVQVAEKLAAVGAKKGITPAQLCLAWVASLGDHVVPIPGSSHADRARENLAAGDIVLTQEDIAAINDAIRNNAVKGDRGRGNRQHENLNG